MRSLPPVMEKSSLDSINSKLCRAGETPMPSTGGLKENMCTSAMVRTLLLPLPSPTAASTTGKAGKARQAHIGFTSFFSNITYLDRNCLDIK